MTIALLALAGCETVETNLTDGIAGANAQFEAAFNSGDAAGLAALYTEDASLMAPNMARLDGRPAIQGLWQHFFDADVSNLDLNTVELIVTGPRASEVGTFSMSTRDGRGGMLTAHGKYIVLWRLDADGVWRLHRDLWNNGPAAVELIAIEPIEPEVTPTAADNQVLLAASDPIQEQAPKAVSESGLEQSPVSSGEIDTNAPTSADAESPQTSEMKSRLAAIIPSRRPKVRPLAAVLDGSGDIVDGRPFVQAGVFSQPENATRLAATLRAADLPANEHPAMLGQRQFTRVLVGPFQTIAERNSAQEVIKRIGPTDAFPVRL
jgi:uncharacterized protein (TIGR02246 family)